MENVLELIKIEKLISMVIALGLIQAIGSLILRRLGPQTGFIISGFISGLISSTAYSATLAKRTKSLSIDQIRIESISYLSSTLAMLIQGLFIVTVGVVDFTKVIIIFVGPIVMTLILIFISAQRSKLINTNFPIRPLFDILSLIKLTIFIIGVVAISNFLQQNFGRMGLGALTFFVSLFEIHGSMIANTQLFSKNFYPLKSFSFCYV